MARAKRKSTRSGPADARAAAALAAGELRWSCRPLRSSRRPPKLSVLLGQERPIKALRTGLELRAPGYNVFLSGLSGTGRATLVRALLEEVRPARGRAPDRVFVNNFRDPSSPLLLTLPRGEGPAFRDEMDELILTIEDSLRAALRARPHKMSRRLVTNNAEARERRLTDALSRQAAKEGCAVVRFEAATGVMAVDIYPIHNGEQINYDALGALVHDGRITRRERDELLRRRESLLERLEEVSERIRKIQRYTEQELRGMDARVAERVLVLHLREFRSRWPQAGDYLDSVRTYLLRNLERWIAEENAETTPPRPEGDDGVPPPPAMAFPELGVHVVKSSESDAACPIVVETNPTYANLFGTIEIPKHGGSPSLEHIHGGALLRADGGYLVVRAADVLAEPGAWRQLLRATKSGKLEIRAYDPGSGTTLGGLAPEAIPIDVKVVMIGEPGVHDHLAAEDPQFLRTFKVHAEFDSTLPATAANLRRYADLVEWRARLDGLRELGPDASAAVAEFGARRAGRRDRLTADFGEVSDLVREASHLCERDGDGAIERRHVRAALRAREDREGLSREHVERDFRDGYLLVRTGGQAVGQVNAMTVIETSSSLFGKCCRITASTGAGRRGSAGLVNIEREAELSGPLHDKGVMILGGYLLDRFGRDGALCLQATLCFEQTYGGVEGDSASSAELYALLSSLGGIPLDQAVAVTGSVNQKGEIQAVSAVNEKVEAFWRLCRTRGLTGRQGVLIPRANVSDLMLDEELIAHAREGRFTVWAVGDVREGLQILSGQDPESAFARIRATLEHFRNHAADRD